MKQAVAIAVVAAIAAAGGYVAYRHTRPGLSPQTTEGAPVDRTETNPEGGSAMAPAQPLQPGAAGPVGSEVPPAGPGGSPLADAPPADSSPADQATAPRLRWINIAAAALGGRVAHVTSTAAEYGWSADALIDGSDPTCGPLCGWASKDASFPQDIVLSFHQQREATIARVVIDTLTVMRRSVLERAPRQVEIAVSTTSADDGFVPVATTELRKEAGEQAIDFAPVAARFVRARLLSNHGGDRVAIGEVSVFEADGPSPSVAADAAPNLALTALGGALVAFTSQYASYGAYKLIDGNPSEEWRSVDGYLPQEFVFALHADESALLDRIVLTPGNTQLSTPRVVVVSVSDSSPVDGYDEVGRITMTQDPGPQAFPIRRRARFVKLRVIENWGMKLFTSLGEVALIEGSAPGYESILRRRSAGTLATAQAAGDAWTDGGGSKSTERERNDDAAHANRLELGATVEGHIEPVGEFDYFQLDVPGPGRSVLTIDLSGRPDIRTSVSLVDARGTQVKQFDPSRATARDTAFSWVVDPGTYDLRLTQPRASLVVIWDTSGSMEGSVADLQRAVEGYLDQVEPTERVNLIRFSHNVEVLLPDFTSDRARLKQATQGKFFADGHTPFYDVVAKAVGMLEGVEGDRAIVVMTDGEDAGSRASRPEFWRLLQDKDVRVHTIGLGELDRFSRTLASTPRRLLAHIAMATNGRSFFTRQSGELATYYRALSEDLRRRASYRLRVRRAGATGTLDVRATGERITSLAAPSHVELILDASGSMKRMVGRQRMIDTARQVLAEVVESLPDTMHVALRVYGHRIREGRAGACEDSELVVPFAPLDKPKVLSRIRSVGALGTTPIAYSLQQVARDLGQAPGEKIVVLVTDGKEECGGDPAAAVAGLKAQGIDFRLNIVGFGLQDALANDLRRLAQSARGQYVDAKDATALKRGIEQALAVPYDVLDAAGAVVASGVTGQPSQGIPEGVYRIRIKTDHPVDIERVLIVAQQTTAVELRKEASELGVRVVGGSAGQSPVPVPR